jgi:8-oxo-dGTP diphosphatase
MKEYRNPAPTVDIIIEMDDEKRRIILIKRKNPPHGWALPGGFIDYGESAENAAIREAKEETNLDIKLERQFHTYSDPARDPRQHTISVVFIAQAKGKPTGMDDAAEAELFSREEIPAEMAFDHGLILQDYFEHKY